MFLIFFLCKYIVGSEFSKILWIIVSLKGDVFSFDSVKKRETSKVFTAKSIAVVSTLFICCCFFFNNFGLVIYLDR
jgi:hypothetical protein